MRAIQPGRCLTRRHHARRCSFLLLQVMPGVPRRAEHGIRVEGFHRPRPGPPARCSVFSPPEGWAQSARSRVSSTTIRSSAQTRTPCEAGVCDGPEPLKRHPALLRPPATATSARRAIGQPHTPPGPCGAVRLGKGSSRRGAPPAPPVRELRTSTIPHTRRLPRACAPAWADGPWPVPTVPGSHRPWAVDGHGPTSSWSSFVDLSPCRSCSASPPKDDLGHAAEGT